VSVISKSTGKMTGCSVPAFQFNKVSFGKLAQ